MSDSITPEQRFAEWWQQKFAEVCEDEDRAFAHEGYLTGYEIGYAQGQAAMQEEVDQLRVQLAGCLTAAEGGTNNPAKQGDYGWSLAYQRTLELRMRLDALLPAEAGGGTP